MGPNSVGIQQLLHQLEPAPRERTVLRASVPLKRPFPLNGLVVHGQREDPVWFDAASGVASDGEWVKTEVLSAPSADGFVADTHGANVCDAVQGIAQLVIGETPDLVAAGG